MDKSQQNLKLVSVNFVRSLITLAIGIGCAVFGLWVANALFGVQINRSLDLKEDGAFILGSGLVILVAILPITYVAYGCSFLIVRPFIEPIEYESLVQKELRSPGFGPLRRFLLSDSR
jgi:hypothetical protein